MELDHEREREINYERMRQRERDRERDRERERERERDPREKEAHQRDGLGYIHPIVPAPVPRKPDDGSSHPGYPYTQVSFSAVLGAVDKSLNIYRCQGHPILILMHTTLMHHPRMSTPMSIRTHTPIRTRTRTNTCRAIILILLLRT
jgi:hypothetical protein